MAKAKKFNDSTVTIVTDINADEYIILTDGAGKTKRITRANLLKSMLGGAALNDIYDNVFIAHHRKSDGVLLAWRPESWTAQQNAGEIADGVLLVEGGRHLLIAPTEGPSDGLLWSSAAVSGGGTTTTARATAQVDWNGKENTAAQIQRTECQGTAYAPGFCAAYQRSNGNGHGVLAGQWWLPSEAQLWMMYANFHKINYALSLIEGATPLAATAYWSSTEYSAPYAWALNFSRGYQSHYTKATPGARVRPVSAW